MPWFGRRDGVLVKDVPNYRRMMPFIMPTRTESAVYFEQSIDVGPATAFLEDWNAKHPGKRATFLHLVLAAVTKTIAERPRLNRFTMGSKLYQRNGIFISYSAKKRLDDAAPIVVIKQKMEPAATFERIVDDTIAAVGEGKSDRENHIDRELKLFLVLPAFVLRWAVGVVKWLDAWNLLPYAFFRDDPMYASVFVANLGSLKLDAAYHHNYEYGNIPLFVTIGRRQDVLVPGPGGAPVVRKEVLLRWTLDERVEDGLYCAAALELVRKALENPAEALS